MREKITVLRIALLIVCGLFIGCATAGTPGQWNTDAKAPAPVENQSDLEDAILVASLGPAPTIGKWSVNPAILTASAKPAADDAPAPASDQGNSALAKAAQNPVANMISLPIQNNTSFGIGPNDRTQNVTNIQPVIPFNMGDFNIITRTIVPLIYQPYLDQDCGGDYGLGDINTTAFLSPADAGELTWGIGPILVMPTATKDSLGSKKWSAGLSGLGLWQSGPWVIGVLVNNVWSFAGSSSADDINSMLLQYFVNYNLDDGWYLTSAPIMTANWEADKGGDIWTVPVGGGFGKVLKIGKQPVNAQIQAFYVVNSPTIGPNWQLRLQFQFLFPK